MGHLPANQSIRQLSVAPATKGHVQIVQCWGGGEWPSALTSPAPAKRGMEKAGEVAVDRSLLHHFHTSSTCEMFMYFFSFFLFLFFFFYVSQGYCD